MQRASAITSKCPSAQAILALGLKSGLPSIGGSSPCTFVSIGTSHFSAASLLQIEPLTVCLQETLVVGEVQEFSELVDVVRGRPMCNSCHLQSRTVCLGYFSINNMPNKSEFRLDELTLFQLAMELLTFDDVQKYCKVLKGFFKLLPEIRMSSRYTAKRADARTDHICMSGR